MTPEYELLGTLHQFPFGAVVTHDTTPIIEQRYTWLEQRGYLEQVAGARDDKGYLVHRSYVLTEAGGYLAWKVATGHYCGSCYWWREGLCTTPETPETVNCGEQPWHSLCEQWMERE